MENEDIRRKWEAHVAALARHVNLGWWLERWLPWVLALSLIGAAVMLGIRYLALPWLQLTWSVLGGLISLMMLLAWWQARRRFETCDTARVRLEDALGLHTRLSAALSGVGSWPSLPRDGVRFPIAWRWQRPLSVLGMSVAMLVLAAWIPIAQRAAPKPRVIEKPSAVKQIEAWAEQLQKDQAIDPKAVDEVEKKIEELLSRPKDEWYEHASLEAAEHLRDQMGKSLQELGVEMEQAKSSLETLSELAESLTPEEKEGLAKQLSETLQGMRSGAMKAGEDLQKQLNSLNPDAMKGMSKEQMKALADRLKQNAEALRNALANAPQFDFKETPMKGPGEGKGEGDQPGQGAPTRGKADADLTLKKNEANLKTNNLQALDPMMAPARIAPGDLLGTSNGKHKVDKDAYQGSQSGGALNGLGDGGGAVGKNNLVPAEREVLKRFFK